MVHVPGLGNGRPGGSLRPSGSNREILARPNPCAKECSSCDWTSVQATACITGARERPSSFFWVAAASGGKTQILPPRWMAGNDTNKARYKMALTRNYRETVVARNQLDPKFARALYAEAVSSLLE